LRLAQSALNGGHHFLTENSATRVGDDHNRARTISFNASEIQYVAVRSMDDTERFVSRRTF
jgi:hypothetical protein